MSMTDRADEIALFRKMAEYLGVSCCKDIGNDPCAYCEKALADIRAYGDERAKGEWVSVEERLPVYPDDYTETAHGALSILIAGLGRVNLTTAEPKELGTMFGVTHWLAMPLPEPPEVP